VDEILNILIHIISLQLKLFLFLVYLNRIESDYFFKDNLLSQMVSNGSRSEKARADETDIRTSEKSEVSLFRYQITFCFAICRFWLSNWYRRETVKNKKKSGEYSEKFRHVFPSIYTRQMIKWKTNIASKLKQYLFSFF